MLDKIIRRGTLYVGMTLIVPWAMRNKSGEFIGFEIDVAQRLAGDMGIKVEFMPTNYPDLVPALQAGDFDIIISGLGITPSRNLLVNCTQPYNSYVLGIAVNRQQLPEVSSVDDLNKSEIFIARRGFDTESIRKQYFPLARCHRFDDDADGFRATLSGKTHAVMTLEPKPRFITAQHPNVLYQPPALQTLKTYHAAFELNKGDPDSLNFYNNWIFLRNNDGWLADRRAYWFESIEWFSEINDNPFLI
jgi:polar amino acid transport system substrate-binding protein